MVLGGVWGCTVSWMMLGDHVFPEFFTPAFTTDVLYTPDTSRTPCPATPVERYSDTPGYTRIHRCIRYSYTAEHFPSRYIPLCQTNE